MRDIGRIIVWLPAIIVASSFVIVVFSAIRGLLRLVFSGKARRKAFDATTDTLDVAGTRIDQFTDYLRANARGLVPISVNGGTRAVNRWLVGLAIGLAGFVLVASFVSSYDDGGLLVVLAVIVLIIYFASWTARRSSELRSKTQNSSGPPSAS
jgi:hypothetical protein